VEPEVLWYEYKNNNLLNNEIPSEEIEPPPLSPVEDTCFARSCVDLCHQTVAATTNISVEDVKRCGHCFVNESPLYEATNTDYD